MIGNRPPFAIVSPAFRFRALASHAGRASLGGDREVALACFATARLAAAMLAPYLLTPADSLTRAISTKQWLASLALPAPARAVLNAAIDAIASGNRRSASSAIGELATVCAGQLDLASSGELKELAAELLS